MQEILVTTDSSQKFRTVVDGCRLTVRLDWNEQASGWLLSLLKVDGTPLSLSARLKTGVPVLSSVLVPNVPGDFIVLPLTSPKQEIGREAWGDTHRLYFATHEEIEEQGVALF